MSDADSSSWGCRMAPPGPQLQGPGTCAVRASQSALADRTAHGIDCYAKSEFAIIHIYYAAPFQVASSALTSVVLSLP